MIDIHLWLAQFLQALEKTFGSRVWFVGLQGSYGRGEATETSDIDPVVILDELSPLDIQNYNKMLDTLPHRELICGFLSGRGELLCWDPADLFQFYYDTKPIRGSLDALLPLLDEAAVRRAIKMGACNIYHGCVHNMLCKKSEKILKGLYKSASFVVQAIAFLQTGTYLRHQQELGEVLSPEEKTILDTFWHLKNGGGVNFAEMTQNLLVWSQTWIQKLPN